MLLRRDRAAEPVTDPGKNNDIDLFSADFRSNRKLVFARNLYSAHIAEQPLANRASVLLVEEA